MQCCRLVIISHDLMHFRAQILGIFIDFVFSAVACAYSSGYYFNDSDHFEGQNAN